MQRGDIPEGCLFPQSFISEFWHEFHLLRLHGWSQGSRCLSDQVGLFGIQRWPASGWILLRWPTDGHGWWTECPKYTDPLWWQQRPTQLVPIDTNLVHLLSLTCSVCEHTERRVPGWKATKVSISFGTNERNGCLQMEDPIDTGQLCPESSRSGIQFFLRHETTIGKSFEQV